MSGLDVVAPEPMPIPMPVPMRVPELTLQELGRGLVQVRRMRGLDRVELSRRTRLSPPVIDALESGDARRMPPRVYVRGYLRTYADAVGLDADHLVSRWQEVAKPAGETPRAAPEKHRLRAPPVRAAMALLVALAMIFLLLTVLRGPRAKAPLQLRRAAAVVGRAAYVAEAPGRR